MLMAFLCVFYDAFAHFAMFFCTVLSDYNTLVITLQTRCKSITKAL
jgi:hypothetical protein